MKPNPRSRTSRLIVPLPIEVSLNARAQGEEYQFPFQRQPLNATVAAATGSSCAAFRSGCRPTLAAAALFRHVDVNGRAEAGLGLVQIVANLEDKLVTPGWQLHFNLVFSVTKMDPGRRL